MATVTGTFTGTGNSVELSGGEIAIDLTFAGAATVNVQWQVDGTNWRTIETFSGSAQRVYQAPGIPVRLNCSAFTNNVSYAMASR